MVSATLNQDIKELAQLALKQPLQFTVSQQQRLADIASLRLTQYLVRLPDKEEGVKGLPVKHKSDVKDTEAHEEAKQDKDSDIIGDDEDEEGEEDMEDDMDESDDEQGEDEIDEDASYHQSFDDDDEESG